MVSLASDPTCPTLKVGERAFLSLPVLRRFPSPIDALVVPPPLNSWSPTNMPHAHSDIEMPDPITIADVKEIAKKRLDPAAWDYYITVADDEQSVRRNETIFKK